MADRRSGKHWRLASHNLILDKVNASRGDLALGMVSSRVASPVFADWFRQPAAGSRFVIAALDEDLQRRLGAQQKAVLLSDETLAKQKVSHPDLTAEEYQLLPEIFHKGRVIRENEHNIHFYAIRGRLYKAVVKITQKRHENYLTTFHRARKKQVESETRGGLLIRDWRENRIEGRP